MNARSLIAAAALALAASGCAFVPKQNARLDEARLAHAAMQANADVARLAPTEARRADEALARAAEASDSLQDPALVDHLAYVARQRALIATEAARRAAIEQRIQTRHLPAGSRS